MIIVAIDETNFLKASEILNKLDPKKCMIKIGSVSFNCLGHQIIHYVAEKGFDEKYGARPLNRAIQKYIEDPLAEEIIQKKVKEGDVIKIDFDKKKEEIIVIIEDVKKKSKSKKD